MADTIYGNMHTLIDNVQCTEMDPKNSGNLTNGTDDHYVPSTESNTITQYRVYVIRHFVAYSQTATASLRR